MQQTKRLCHTCNHCTTIHLENLEGPFYLCHAISDYVENVRANNCKNYKPLKRSCLNCEHARSWFSDEVKILECSKIAPPWDTKVRQVVSGDEELVNLRCQFYKRRKRQSGNE